MRSLSGMMTHMGASIMILMVPPAVGADDLVPLNTLGTRANIHLASTGSFPGQPGCPGGEPHPSAVFWRGFCLCESICEQAKLDRFRYPDYLRHRRYVANHSETPLHHHLAAAGPALERQAGAPYAAPAVRTGLLNWLSRALHLNRRQYRVISIHDKAVVTPLGAPGDGQDAELDEQPQSPTHDEGIESRPSGESAPLEDEPWDEPSPVEPDQDKAHVLKPDAVPTFLTPKLMGIGPSDEKAIAFPAPTAEQRIRMQPPTPSDPAHGEWDTTLPRNTAPQASPPAVPTEESANRDTFGHLFD